MRKHANKAHMPSTATAAKIEIPEKPESFYSRVWEGATGFFITVTGRATGNVGDLFPKNTQTEGIPRITATYTSSHLEDVDGNWNILLPREPVKKASD